MTGENAASATGRHQRWMEREWSDDYPDTLYVSVQTSDADGTAFVVVTGQAVWLRPEQVVEVILHLAECKAVVEAANAQRLELQQPPKPDPGASS